MSKCPDNPKQHECVKNRIRGEGGESNDINEDSRSVCCKKVEPCGIKGSQESKTEITEGLFKGFNYFNFPNSIGSDPLSKRFSRNFRAGLVGTMASYLLGGYVYQMHLRQKREDELRKRRDEEDQERGSGVGDLVENASHQGGSVGNKRLVEPIPANADNVEIIGMTDDFIEKHTISNDKINNVFWKVIRGKATHMVAIVERESGTTEGSYPSDELQFESDDKPIETGLNNSDEVFLKYAEAKAKRKREPQPKRYQTTSWS